MTAIIRISEIQTKSHSNKPVIYLFYYFCFCSKLSI
ncbi:rCG24506 [Rattus norvegicus]|uniref:RCG24506 n=1 Tax=Rattus norvegicus TaxID=10116 RepID=A6K6S1_RAT|nr:rCG24506 [Rattus norvegicus]